MKYNYFKNRKKQKQNIAKGDDKKSRNKLMLQRANDGGRLVLDLF